MEHLFPIILFISLALFSCEKKTNTKEILMEKLADSSLSWNGDTLPSYPEGQPKVTILKDSIPPKAKLEMHEHLVINAGLLLKGELTVIDEFENRLEMKAGDVATPITQIKE